MARVITGGIDVGSSAVKVALVDAAPGARAPANPQRPFSDCKKNGYI